MQQRFGVVQSPLGNAIAGASVTVRTSPGGVLATLYSDDGVTSLANPVTTNRQGEYSYYAANGRYSETVSGTGFTSETNSDSVLLNDPEDADFVRVTPQDYMTKAQRDDVASFTGSLDVTAALQDALDAVHDAGGGEVYLPPGRYRKADTADTLVMYSNTTIRGCGDASIIFHDDRDTNPRKDLLSASNTSNIAFRDFRIEGTALTYTNETNQSQTLTGGTIDGLVMDGVTIEKVRYMATAFNNVKRVQCANNRLDYVVRDGLRFTNAESVVISGNVLRRVADDCIALHALDASAVPGSGFVVEGNVIEACQGIKVLGAKMLTVRHNVLRRTLRTPINVELPDSGTEGVTPQFAIDISGNNITDSFGNFGSNYVIRVASKRARATGGVGSQPGVNSTPYAYNYLQDLDTGSPVNVGTWGVRINNNTIARTRNTAAAYSAWGYGSLFDRTITNFVGDPAITSTDFQVHGIIAIAPISGLQIQNNNISGCGTGFNGILLDVTGSTNIQDFADVTIDGNLFVDCPGVGIGCSVLGSGAGAKQIIVRNNTFDLDPYFRAASHNADNTWTTAGAVVGISVANTIGVIASGNVFKNLGNPGFASTTTVESGLNVVYSDFVGTGDNAGNKGVRQLPSPAVSIVVPIDGDPTSATFGQIQNAVATRAGSIPTTGKYLSGHRVWKDGPALAGGAGSQYIVIGWIRATTGSNHVLNTDWYEMRTLTGT